LGCYPGSFMAYFNKRFGYRVYGIDTIKGIDIIQKNLTAVDVPVQAIIQADIMNMPFKRNFDIVASFGLIEHFTNPQIVINRHCEIVAPGGYLIISIPHFRGIQYWLHRWFDAEVLTTHNLNAMYPTILSHWVEINGFSVLNCNYFQTFDFWTLDEPISKFRRVTYHLFMSFTSIVKELMDISRTNQIPNPWLSPHILLVARKNPE